jgi:hypothetical protein
VAVVHSVAEVRAVLEENQLLGRTLGDDPAYIVSE